MSTLPSNASLSEYRVIFLHPHSRSLLVGESADSRCVARVPVPIGTRPVEQLRKAVSTRWGLNILVLDLIPSDPPMSPLAITEVFVREIPPTFKAICSEEIKDGELTESERRHLQKILDGTVEHPLARIGWIKEAVSWLEEVTGNRVVQESGIEQYNAGGAFTLVRFRMQDGRGYWLKATGKPNGHERAITSLLSRLCPDHLPTLIAERPAWNAWLTLEEGKAISMLFPESHALSSLLEGAVESMAELQVKTVGFHENLLAAGAFDHRLHAL